MRGLRHVDTSTRHKVLRFIETKRYEAKMSQVQLSKKLGDVHPQYYSSSITGKLPGLQQSLERIDKLLAVFGYELAIRKKKKDV